MKKALILIDIQNDYFAGGKSPLFEPECALANAKKALQAFRAASLPVIHVQHINTRPGATFFLPETEGVKIHPALLPERGEFIIVKHTPNSFYETNLAEILEQNSIASLIACGMMSHMCIDTTVRAAKDYGVAVTLLEDACTTKDLSFDGQFIPATTVHTAFMAALAGMFANVMKTENLSI